MRYVGARRMRGGSFLKKVGKFIKDHRLLSTGGKFLSGVIPGVAGQAIGAAGNFAAQHGYGRRRRRVRRRRRR